jgi:hypothetical protein
MATRIAKFASAIFASLLAGAPITIITSSFAHAAGDCQTEPGSETRQGQHWYYRIEHGTKRHCWYLREEGERAEQATSSEGTAAASRRNETAVRGSIADAHGELPSPRVRVQQDGGASAARRPRANMPTAATPEDNQYPGASASPADGVPRSLVASRLPELWAVDSSVNPAPEPSATMVADANPTPQAESSPAIAPVTLAAAAAPIQKTGGSLRMVLLVILGALALASLMGKVVYRLGRARHVARAVARRRAIWESADPARSPSSADPQTGNLATRPDFAGRPDFARADIQASPPDKGVEQIEEFIEEFLVRLSKLSQAGRRTEVGPHATSLTM